MNNIKMTICKKAKIYGPKNRNEFLNVSSIKRGINIVIL